MKHTLLLLSLLACTLGLRAQQMDSAAMIVDHYLQRLNHQALHPDSALYIESRIYTLGQTDTLLLRRWHAEPHLDRIELWHNGQMGLGFCSDGHIHLTYDSKRRAWHPVDHESFLNQASAYDFRGPLHNWRTMGVELTYLGPIDFQGNPCWRILVRDPSRMDRHYIFSQRDGMLFFINELETSLTELREDTPRVDWRAISAYTPFGASVMVGQECYQNEQGITVSDHQYSYRPIDIKIFQPK